jgi:hypothetical protein
MGTRTIGNEARRSSAWVGVGTIGREESRRKASFGLADTWWREIRNSSTACDLGC